MATVFNGYEQKQAAVQGDTVSAIVKGGNIVFQYLPAEVKLTNKVANGSFETNTTAWSVSTGAISRITVPTPVHGEYGSWAGRMDAKLNGVFYIQVSTAISVVSGRKYYIRNQQRFTYAGFNNVARYMNNGTAFSPAITNTIPTVNTWNILDGVWTANSATLQLRIEWSGGNGNQQRGNDFDNIMVIDLTDAFGAGAEPSAATMRSIVTKNGGYWDGGKIVTI